MEVLLILLVTVPLITAFLIPLIDIINKEKRKILVIIAALVEFIIFVLLIINNFNEILEGTLFLKYHLGGWVPPLGINLAMDMLSFYFSFLITFSVMFLLIYSIGFIGHHEGKYYVILFIIWAAMQGIILTGDIFNFYILIELILITSSALIAFRRNREGTEAAIKYMVYGIIGGLFIFLGVLLVYTNLGTLNFAEISLNFNKLPLKAQRYISLIFLFGLIIKLGIFPFHFWVAKAQSAAPSPISALLSGVVEKIYIYAFLRIFWHLFGFNVLSDMGINKLIIYGALLSSMIGHLLALYEKDLKRMLAYSTIGHLGIIVAVLAVNTKLAILGGLLHVLSHLLMKISLFTTAGYILQYSPGKNIKDGRGVAYRNKLVFSGFIVAAAGMMGLPPMIGFFSKLLIIKSFQASNLYLASLLIVLGSIIALIYYFRYINYGFKSISLKTKGEFHLILSVLYRKRLVRDLALVFVALIVVSGLFYNFALIPLTEVVNTIQAPTIYIESILGGI